MRWQDGYPCDSGSTDGADSARLAGLMKLFKHPEASKFKTQDYFRNGEYLRHPVEGNKYKISRDQMVPLVAGSFVGDRNIFSTHLQYYNPPNGDYISPSVRDHFRICAGGKPSLIGQAWLWIDVLWSVYIKPLAEPNQLIAMLMVHPNKSYLKAWCRLNKYWMASIMEDWCFGSGAWRGERELAELMISTIKEKIK
jgi:hypothetical protein